MAISTAVARGASEGEHATELARRACVVIPAYMAERSVAAVIGEVARVLPELAIIVVDDGSVDRTSDVAEQAGARVVRHVGNQGKGAALMTALRTADELGFEMALSVDADGQHPAESARAVLFASTDPRAVVLGVRNLRRDGAPRKNQASNAISNFFLSRFAARPLHDTQCGLRRYPVKETLALGARAQGFAFEAEVVLRAVAAELPVIEESVFVIYPPEEERVTHFHVVRDPLAIIVTVIRTVRDLGSRKARGPRSG